MSVQYLLDGYNLIHQMPSVISKYKLEDQRKALINWIEKNNPQGSLRNKVTIVFDGKSGIWSEEGTGCVSVIFSCAESADERIKKMVAESKYKKNLIVVTNDRQIQYSVRSQGAKVMSVQEFLSPPQTQNRKKGASQGGATSGEQPQKSISKTLEHKITNEMKKIWLKEH